MLSFNEYLQIFVGVMAILSPFSAIPLFLSLTASQNSQTRKVMANTTSFATAVVMLVSAWFGEMVLSLFGIGIPAFRVAGGILLLLMSINMINAKVPRAKNTPEELDEARESVQSADDAKHLAIVPMAIPILAGPGAISTVILYANQASGFMHSVAMSGVILAVMSIIWFSLRLAVPIGKMLGTIGINIFSRIMGLILAAISIEFISSGLLQLFPGWQ